MKDLIRNDQAFFLRVNEAELQRSPHTAGPVYGDDVGHVGGYGTLKVQPSRKRVKVGRSFLMRRKSQKAYACFQTPQISHAAHEDQATLESGMLK